MHEGTARCHKKRLFLLVYTALKTQAPLSHICFPNRLPEIGAGFCQKMHCFDTGRPTQQNGEFN